MRECGMDGWGGEGVGSRMNRGWAEKVMGEGKRETRRKRRTGGLWVGEEGREYGRRQERGREEKWRGDGEGLSTRAQNFPQENMPELFQRI